MDKIKVARIAQTVPVLNEELKTDTSLEQFICYLDIGEIAPVHLIKFLTNPKSRLRVLGHLKITKKLLTKLILYIIIFNKSFALLI